MVSKIEIDFNVPALSFDKKPLDPSVPDATLASFLGGGILSNARSGPVLKMYGWCYSLGEKEVLSLDEADFKTLYETIEKSESAIILKGQLMQLMDKAKDKAEKA